MEYLNALFPDVSMNLALDKTKHRYNVEAPLLISDEKKMEICNKLKLTSLHFVRFDNRVIN